MCTSLRIKAADGTVLVGRTMEYALDVNWELRAVPRGVRQSSTVPDGEGLRWQGRYGYVGMGIGETTALGFTISSQPSVPDGVNEQGLYAGLRYLPTYAEYQDPTGAPRDRLLAPIDLAAYALATCATVAQAIGALERTVVCAAPMPVIGVPPLHLVLHDRTGAAAVAEWVGGTSLLAAQPIYLPPNPGWRTDSDIERFSARRTFRPSHDLQQEREFIALRRPGTQVCDVAAMQALEFSYHGRSAILRWLKQGGCHVACGHGPGAAGWSHGAGH